MFVNKSFDLRIHLYTDLLSLTLAMFYGLRCKNKIQLCFYILHIYTMCSYVKYIRYDVQICVYVRHLFIMNLHSICALGTYYTILSNAICKYSVYVKYYDQRKFKFKLMG